MSDLPDKPLSRTEAYLAKAAGQSVELPEKPESRLEQYLNKIATSGGGGGTSDFNDLSNRPKLNSTAMTGSTNITNFTGTDGNTAGAQGLVPAPATTDADKYLKSDGTWASAGGGGDTVYSNKQTSDSDNGGAVFIGNLNSSQQEIADPSTTDGHYSYFVALPGDNTAIPKDKDIFIMGKPYNANGTEHIAIGHDSVASDNSVAVGHSAQATSSSTIAFGNNAKASSDRCVAIGRDSKASSTYAIAIGVNANSTSNFSIVIGSASASHGTKNSLSSIAIGYKSKVYYTDYSIALGEGAEATRQGELNIGAVDSSVNTHGFNNTSYRVIGGVHDGQNNHDAATVAQGNTLSTTAPTTSTVGVLGQLYTDTTNLHTYQCTAIDTTDPSNPSYSWTQRW